MIQSSIDKTIMSASNALFSDWLDCLTGKGIKKHGLFFIAGERAVSDTIERFPALARSLILCADRHMTSANTTTGRGEAKAEIRGFIDRARTLTAENDQRFSVIALDRKLFDQLDIAGTHSPLLLAITPEISDADLSSEPEGLEIICALGDPSNVGALLRSAAAFGASKIILLRECASPFQPKAVRAASASTLVTPMYRGPSIRDLPALFETGRAKGPLLALDMHGKNITTFQWPKNVRLLLGEEGKGVPGSKAFEFLSIPMQGDVESLNATVAASVALYDYASKSR